MKDCYASERLTEKATGETREAKCLKKKDEKQWDLANSRGNNSYVIT